MAELDLVVGLGNPGREYERTRHNAGFLLLERLAQRWKAEWSLERKFQARLARAIVGGRSWLLCQPQTYMNQSGETVQALASYYQTPADRVLIALDDADLPFGEIRLRPGGGTGGHHGLESIEQHLGTQEYARLRIGIGRRDPEQREITGHVLGRFAADEIELLDKVLEWAADQAECWSSGGIQKAMSQFNGVIELKKEAK